ncbi:hypothetical protein AAG906_036855 [Vitis piasezkii]
MPPQAWRPICHPQAHDMLMRREHARDTVGSPRTQQQSPRAPYTLQPGRVPCPPCGHAPMQRCWSSRPDESRSARDAGRSEPDGGEWCLVAGRQFLARNEPPPHRLFILSLRRNKPWAPRCRGSRVAFLTDGIVLERCLSPPGPPRVRATRSGRRPMVAPRMRTHERGRAWPATAAGFSDAEP